jgi:2-dehydro-3-deoxygluconokinase
MTVLCFGEMLVRFAPDTDGTLGEADALRLHVAGAEANVAISLASLGTSARMATVLPDNALGARALQTLVAHGVRTDACLRRPGRMGLYFIEAPRAGREGGFFYDRGDTAFARAATEIGWLGALQGATWLHISGLTAALGDTPVAAMRGAVAAAREHGVAISFDCNFRPQLWADRIDDARALIREFAGAATLVFASNWDAQLILADDSADQASLLEIFPDARWIATTRRTDGPGSPRLGAVLASSSAITEIAPTAISPFVERIGAGDAFAAALLHALASGWDDAEALNFAHRACLRKHGLPGDFSPLSAADILSDEKARLPR